MLEVPAVVEIVDELAREADFLSIGTNDFVQYLLGVDRANDQVAYAYRPSIPRSSGRSNALAMPPAGPAKT